MFNCYVVVFASSDFCYFKTETAAENFITIWNEVRSPASYMKVEGRYIPGVF
jgi:hypothetical protein